MWGIFIMYKYVNNYLQYLDKTDLGLFFVY